MELSRQITNRRTLGERKLGGLKSVLKWSRKLARGSYTTTATSLTTLRMVRYPPPPARLPRRKTSAATASWGRGQEGWWIDKCSSWRGSLNRWRCYMPPLVLAAICTETVVCSTTHVHVEFSVVIRRVTRPFFADCNFIPFDHAILGELTTMLSIFLQIFIKSCLRPVLAYFLACRTAIVP